MKTKRVAIFAVLAFCSVFLVLSSCGTKKSDQDQTRTTVIPAIKLAIHGISMIPDSLRDSVSIRTLARLRALSARLSSQSVCGDTSPETLNLYSFQDCCPCDSVGGRDLCCPCPEMEAMALISCSDWQTVIYVDDAPLQAVEEEGRQLYNVSEIEEGDHMMGISGTFAEDTIKFSVSVQDGRIKIKPGRK